MQDNVLQLDAVNAFYDESHVLHDVSLGLKSGKVLALLGRNGAGKTTTVHTVVGFMPIRTGEIRAFGDKINGTAPEWVAHKRIALVPQGRRVFKSLSVLENLNVARLRKTTAFDHDVLFDWFPRLRERRHQPAGSLSGGEQQMLAIARALIGDPKIVLFDEPSEGLAPQIVKEVGQILRRLKNAGLSIVLVEQNTKLALELADEVVILNTGRVAFSGTASDLAKQPDIINQHLGVH